MPRLEDMSNEERAVFLEKAQSQAAMGPFLLVGGIGACAFAGWSFVAISEDSILSIVIGFCGIILALAGAYWSSNGKEGVTRYNAFEKQQNSQHYQPVHQPPVQHYQSTPPNPKQYYPSPVDQHQPASPIINIKFCPYCGTNNPQEYNYCKNCQKPLS